MPTINHYTTVLFCSLFALIGCTATLESEPITERLSTGQSTQQFTLETTQTLIRQSEVVDLAQPLTFTNEEIFSLETKALSWAVVDKENVYWTENDRSGDLLVHSIVDNQTSVLLSTTYEAGHLTIMRLLRHNQWLTFLDSQYWSAGTPWRLRSVHVDTGEIITLAENVEGKSIPQLRASGDIVSSSFVDALSNPNCIETVVTLYNVREMTTQEISRSCAEEKFMWSFPALSGDYLTVGREQSDSEGGGNDIFLFNLAEQTEIQVTNDGASSIPDISESWLVWKNSRRFEEPDSSSVLNRESGLLSIFNIGYNGPRLANDSWLYWEPNITGPIYLYNLQAKKLYLATSPRDGEFIRSINSYDDRLIWWRQYASEKEGTSGAIEWIMFPN